ncbi:MAG: GNAT family N-acetyltransferase [Oscillospiraceae bacterium]|nr:GNAT family N-acetyltransferase [Oscillospiraceae bacterium]
MNMEYSLIIRKAVKADAPYILDILSDSFGQYIKQSFIPLRLEDMLDDIISIERDIENIDVFIALIDGVPVGTVRVATREGAPAMLTKLGVVSGYNNIGIGKSLMNLVDKVVAERGAKSLELYTASKNTSIMRFYYGRGFYVDSTSKERGYIRALMRKDYE